MSKMNDPGYLIPKFMSLIGEKRRMFQEEFLTFMGEGLEKGEHYNGAGFNKDLEEIKHDILEEVRDAATYAAIGYQAGVMPASQAVEIFEESLALWRRVQQPGLGLDEFLHEPRRSGRVCETCINFSHLEAECAKFMHAYRTKTTAQTMSSFHRWLQMNHNYHLSEGALKAHLQNHVR